MSSRTTYNDLLEAGVHFGHLKRKWNPGMAPYIFMEKNGIHIIDLNKTLVKIDEAASALKQIAKSGKKVLFVATKKQAKEVVTDKVKAVNMPYVTERWPGGMLTNFATIRKTIKKMTSIDKLMTDPSFAGVSKKEKLTMSRERDKLQKVFGSIADLSRLPAALFIVDITKEHIAVQEARRLNIPTFGIVDTNSDPRLVDYAIPANDDATKSITLIIELMTKAIAEGLSERKVDKEAADAEREEAEGRESQSTNKIVSGKAQKFLNEDESEAERTAKKPALRGSGAGKPGNRVGAGARKK